MTTRLLIDGIMRQTTVLIAELSTNAGLRAPLAHVADQVFVDLAREIEAQGVSQKVVADMFGLALRTYSKRVNKLADVKPTTQREAIVRLLMGSETGSASLSSIEHALVPTADAGPHRRNTLRSVLRDLVNSGLVYKTGRGQEAIYGLVDREVLHQQAMPDDYVCLEVFQRGPLGRDEIAEIVSIDARELDEALERLVSSGRLQFGEDATYRSEELRLNVDGESGWEAAVLDHFRAVAATIAAKLRTGETDSRDDDTVGGMTFSFEMAPGHPLRAEVDGLLSRTRSQVSDLWDRVNSVNGDLGSDAAERERVYFYFGQSAIERDDDENGESNR